MNLRNLLAVPHENVGGVSNPKSINWYRNYWVAGARSVKEGGFRWEYDNQVFNYTRNGLVKL